MQATFQSFAIEAKIAVPDSDSLFADVTETEVQFVEHGHCAENAMENFLEKCKPGTTLIEIVTVEGAPYVSEGIVPDSLEIFLARKTEEIQ